MLDIGEFQVETEGVFDSNDRASGMGFGFD